MVRIRFILFALLLPELCTLRAGAVDTPSPGARSQSAVSIAVVREGASWLFDEIDNSVRKELSALTKGEAGATFIDDPRFDAGWKPSRAEEVLRAAYEDPRVDIVVILGPTIAAKVAAEARALPKPTLVGLALDADLLGAHSDAQGHSLTPNFAFVAIPHRVRNDVEAFKQLVSFTTLYVVLDSSVANNAEMTGRVFRPIEKELGFSTAIIAAGETSDGIIASLGDNARAVYLTPPLRMSAQERGKLIAGINAKKIPSFSLMGLPDVEAGVLAGIVPRLMDIISRRIALNLHQLMRGDPATSLPGFLTVDQRLVINAETAQQIGFSLGGEARIRAEIINREAIEKGEPLSLEHAMAIAAEQNVDLFIENAKVDRSKQDSNKAMSRLLPQVGGALNYAQIDKDRAEASLGSIPELESRLGFQATQVLFDDAVFSRVRASKHEYERQKYSREDIRLDIMQLAGNRFLDYLSARAVLRIQESNYRLTRSNLDVARTRYETGAGGKEEIYRWETALAADKSAVLQAASATEEARVALNQALGVDQKRQWRALDIILSDDDLHFLGNRVKAPLAGVPGSMKAFEDFAVLYACENSPSRMAIAQAIDAQKIVLGQLERRFVLPNFNAGFSMDHQVGSRYAGQPINDFLSGAGASSIPGISRADRDDWMFGLFATLPLFEGGGRVFDVRRARADLDELTSTRERIMQLIEKSTRSSIYSILSSHPSIRLSRIASQRANQNLEIVSVKYSHGTATIIDLLDAQNRVLTEERNAALSVYAYLADLISFQRAISWFEYTKTSEEKDAWLAALSRYLAHDVRGHGRTP